MTQQMAMICRDAGGVKTSDITVGMSIKAEAAARARWAYFLQPVVSGISVHAYCINEDTATDTVTTIGNFRWGASQPKKNSKNKGKNRLKSNV